MVRKTIFVTGAASGIGEATVRRFAADGWFVGVVDIDADGSRAVADDLGSDSGMAITCDVTDRDQLEAAVAAFTERTGGRLDVLHANAGVLFAAPFELLTPGQMDLLIGVNAASVAHLALIALPHLKQTPGSALIITSSASALIGLPTYSVYGATKAFVRNLAEALHFEWAEHDIYVADILPEVVATAMTSNKDNYEGGKSPKAIALGPDDVVDVVVEAIEGRSKIHWLVGETAEQLQVLSRMEDETELRDTLARMVAEA